MKYNLFFDEAGLICAVPENAATPAFVKNRTWKRGGQLPKGVDPEFDTHAAEGFRYNGFYLFEELGQIPSNLLGEPHSQQSRKNSEADVSQ
jgi:hypothetical protein